MVINKWNLCDLIIYALHCLQDKLGWDSMKSVPSSISKGSDTFWDICQQN